VNLLFLKKNNFIIKSELTYAGFQGHSQDFGLVSFAVCHVINVKMVVLCQYNFLFQGFYEMNPSGSINKMCVIEQGIKREYTKC
jgi:hypothetical protein